MHAWRGGPSRCVTNTAAVSTWCSARCCRLSSKRCSVSSGGSTATPSAAPRRASAACSRYDTEPWFSCDVTNRDMNLGAGAVPGRVRRRRRARGRAGRARSARQQSARPSACTAGTCCCTPPAPPRPVPKALPRVIQSTSPPRRIALTCAQRGGCGAGLGGALSRDGRVVPPPAVLLAPAVACSIGSAK